MGSNNQEHKMKISKDKILEIYNNEYLNGMSSRQLGFKYGVVESYFSRWFRKLGLKTFKNDVQSRKYSFNKNYFENIDTEDKAYWLGFMYADGYIQSRRKDGNRKFGLSISSKDIEHLEKFNQCLKSNYPIKEYKVGKSGYVEGNLYCRLLITSEKATNDLINKGCVEHKTDIIKFSTYDQVPKELIRHFIRGYFDGDGSIWSTNKENFPTYSIDFCGTDNFLTGVMNELINNNVIQHEYKFDKRKSEQIVSRFRFGGNNLAKAFCEYIYTDSTIYLQRKFNRYKELLYILDNKPKPMEHKCYVCGDENSIEYDKWNHGGEYNNKILCARHYRQLLKYGKITKIEAPVRVTEKRCFVCNDRNAKSYHIWVKDGEYKNKTLCRKHWEQLYKLGHLKDNKPAKHKESR